jgi:hypothetical protein
MDSIRFHRYESSSDDGLPPDERLVPTWVGRLFAVLTVLLIPWTIWLMFDLPSQARADHWDIAWAGFDIALGVSLGTTAITILRRSPWTAITATVTATLLVCDAWFDVMTADTSSAVMRALAEACFAELPLALLCLWVARNVERVLADARPFLVRAGFRVRGGRLVPPDQSP